MWSISHPPGHSGEVSDVAWCPADFNNLVTSSDDGTMRVWRVKRARQEQQQVLGEVVGYTQWTKKDVGKWFVFIIFIIYFIMLVYNNVFAICQRLRLCHLERSVKNISFIYI